VTVIRPGTEEAGTIRDVGVATGAGTSQPSLLTDRGEASFHQRWLGGREGSSAESATGEPPWVLVLGPDLEVAPARLPEEQAARMLQAALDEPSAVSARRRIVGLLRQSAGTGDDAGARPGMDNAGLFSRHYLTRSLPGEERWAAARRRAGPLLDRRGMDLIRGLGFRIGDRLDQALVLLSENSEQRAVAVLLERTETFEAGSGRLDMSPAAYGLDRASKRGAEWLILLRGDQIRLYATKPGTGVGSRSPVDTWFQLDLAALAPEDAGYLDLVFSAAALSPEGAVADLLARSRQFATDLGDRLRQRVYERVIPGLAVGVAEALDRLPGCEGSDDLSYAYRLSPRIFFRLLFQAYAEDRGLLPYGRNDRFDLHSLKRLAVTLSSSDSPAATFDADATTVWRDLQTIWKAIDKGDRGLDVPAYNGGLFDADPGFRREGTDLADIELGDDCIGPALRDLLVDETPDGDIGPVDFRSLSVREFGTIYEGLLESELSRADMDLTVDKKNVYVPARPKDEVVVPKGDVYFHNRSGERKATGSYFTPEFAVEHLLDHALEPVLAEHLKRVEALHGRGDHASAAEAFWDFRVADISMGSGHFPIAAVDRIERGMRSFLADRPLASVNDELRRLERKAREALGSPRATAGGDGPELEPSTLLRRQIARRCIHGVDVNETAVELARVAVWIHTFVPGLPMSTLDHNLVRGDSLTGIGTVDEALGVLDPGRGAAQGSLFSQPIEEAMARAAEALGEVAAVQEADTAEVLRNRKALEGAKARAEPARRLFDAAVDGPAGLGRDEGHGRRRDDRRNRQSARGRGGDRAPATDPHAAGVPAGVREKVARVRRFDRESALGRGDGGRAWLLDRSPPGPEEPEAEGATRHNLAPPGRAARPSQRLRGGAGSSRIATPSADGRTVSGHGDRRPRSLQGVLLAILAPGARRRSGGHRAAPIGAVGQRVRRVATGRARWRRLRRRHTHVEQGPVDVRHGAALHARSRLHPPRCRTPRRHPSARSVRQCPGLRSRHEDPTRPNPRPRVPGLD